MSLEAEQRVVGILLAHPELATEHDIEPAWFTQHADLLRDILRYRHDDALEYRWNDEQRRYALELLAWYSYAPNLLPMHLRTVRQRYELRSLIPAMLTDRKQQPKLFVEIT